MASQVSLPPLTCLPSASNGTMPLGSAPLPSDEATESRGAGVIAGAISTRVVGLLRQRAGRGPTNAKAVISRDLVLVTLSGCLTPAEAAVVRAGHGELVARTRSVLYDGSRAEATAIVEELTHEHVTAYFTAQHGEPDFAILVFCLTAPPLRVA